MSLTPLSLYVHWPFCKKKCPYCDFNSHVRDHIEQGQWRDALLAEMRFMAELLGDDRQLVSIFFGGGTPSLMPPETVAAIINQAQILWTSLDDIEITLEANPTSVEKDRFADFRAAGINRVSLGIQALNDADLQFLGREHSMREALSAIETAQQIFDRYSFDLICARPHQTAAAWEVELKHALSYTAQHLSVYQLTIEPQTAFKTLYDRGDFSLPTDEVCADIYDLTRDLLADAGLQYYEISNYAATGHECRHNLTYWRYQDYAGIGAGAHGRITVKGKKIATRTHKAPEIWLQRVQSIGHACHPFEEIHGKERGLEALMMGLRLKEGLPLSRLETESGLPFDHIIDPNRLDVLVKEGMLRIENQTLYPTDAALCRLDGVLRYLM